MSDETAWVICDEHGKPVAVSLTKKDAMQHLGELLDGPRWQGLLFSLVEVPLADGDA